MTNLFNSSQSCFGMLQLSEEARIWARMMTRCSLLHTMWTRELGVPNIFVFWALQLGDQKSGFALIFRHFSVTRRRASCGIQLCFLSVAPQLITYVSCAAGMGWRAGHRDLHPGAPLGSVQLINTWQTQSSLSGHCVKVEVPCPPV